MGAGSNAEAGAVGDAGAGVGFGGGRVGVSRFGALVARAKDVSVGLGVGVKVKVGALVGKIFASVGVGPRGIGDSCSGMNGAMIKLITVTEPMIIAIATINASARIDCSPARS